MAFDAIWLRLGCAEDCTFGAEDSLQVLEEKVLCAWDLVSGTPLVEEWSRYPVHNMYIYIYMYIYVCVTCVYIYIYYVYNI